MGDEYGAAVRSVTIVVISSGCSELDDIESRAEAATAGSLAQMLAVLLRSEWSTTVWTSKFVPGIGASLEPAATSERKFGTEADEVPIAAVADFGSSA